MCVVAFSVSVVILNCASFLNAHALGAAFERAAGTVIVVLFHSFDFDNNTGILVWSIETLCNFYGSCSQLENWINLNPT